MANQDKQLDKLDKILQIAQDGEVTQDEIIQLFSLVLEKTNESLIGERQTTETEISKERERMGRQVTRLDTRIDDAELKTVTVRQELERRIREIALTPGEKGEKGDKGERGERGEKGNDGKNASVDDVVERILSLDEPWLDASLVKNLPTSRIIERGGAIPGASMVRVLNNGQPTGDTISEINFINATSISYETGNTGRRATVTLPTGGSGSGVTVETPTGTVNSSNDTFSVSDEPQWVVSDGITYFAGAGYSYSAPNITMDIPPSSYIRAII